MSKKLIYLVSPQLLMFFSGAISSGFVIELAVSYHSDNCVLASIPSGLVTSILLFFCSKHAEFIQGLEGKTGGADAHVASYYKEHLLAKKFTLTFSLAILMGLISFFVAVKGLHRNSLESDIEAKRFIKEQIEISLKDFKSLDKNVQLILEGNRIILDSINSSYPKPKLKH